MKGRVLKSTGSWYLVQTDDGTIYPCRTRGRLRLEDSKETNPVAVGDEVLIDQEGQEGVIAEILPRRNHIVRQAARKSAQTQVLAANVDQAILMVTISQPRTSAGFIDRFLVTCQAYGIPQRIIINKVDLLSAEEKEAAEEVARLYEKIGVQAILTSLHQNDHLETIHSWLVGKTTLLAGHSGTGKSTLINKILPGVQQQTSAISAYSEKGVHTTTFAEMFSDGKGLFLIDTPGIKEWGLSGFEPEEISGFFPEMEPLRQHCKFGGSCLHFHEPACAVTAAVECGDIALSRYESFLSMIAGEDNRK